MSDSSLDLYLRVRGRVMGPFNCERLKTLVRRGQLGRLHEVSTDGTNWVRAATYAELFMGTPVKLVVPEEMQVSPPPPAAQPGESESESLAAELVSPPVVSPLTPSAGRLWYYVRDGAENGPVEESVVRRLVATGQIPSEARVWAEGLPQWTTALEAGLLPVAAPPVSGRPVHFAAMASSGFDDSLYNVASSSRPWAMFLAIIAFLYAALWILLGFLTLASGADKGVAPMIAMGFFWIISGVVVAVGGILLINYANRLASLNYSKTSKILENALDRLKAFWMYVSIVLIVVLAFILFFVVWILAIGSSIARWT